MDNLVRLVRDAEKDYATAKSPKEEADIVAALRRALKSLPNLPVPEIRES